MKFYHLNPKVRELMAVELAKDLSEDKFIFSAYVDAKKEGEWISLLKKTFLYHDPSWLSQELKKRDVLKRRSLKNLKEGKFTLALVPRSAEETLAQDEFNLYYIKALCVYALSQGIEELEIYSARRIQNHRPKSESLKGKKVSAEDVLRDLRSSLRGESALGLGLYGSSLSLKIPLDKGAKINKVIVDASEKK